jgi:hypothetical protein
MAEIERETRDSRDGIEHTTTIVETGGDRGSGGVLAIVLLLIVLLVMLFLFRDQLGLGGSTTNIKVPDEINVNVT